MFTCPHNVVQHVRAEHTKETPFKCDYCPESFNRPYVRNRHTSKVHGIKIGPGKGRTRRNRARPGHAPTMHTPNDGAAQSAATPQQQQPLPSFTPTSGDGGSSGTQHDFGASASSSNNLQAFGYNAGNCAFADYPEWELQIGNPNAIDFGSFSQLMSDDATSPDTRARGQQSSPSAAQSGWETAEYLNEGSDDAAYPMLTTSAGTSDTDWQSPFCAEPMLFDQTAYSNEVVDSDASWTRNAADVLSRYIGQAKMNEADDILSRL